MYAAIQSFTRGVHNSEPKHEYVRKAGNLNTHGKLICVHKHRNGIPREHLL